MAIQGNTTAAAASAFISAPASFTPAWPSITPSFWSSCCTLPTNAKHGLLQSSWNNEEQKNKTGNGMRYMNYYNPPLAALQKNTNYTRSCKWNGILPCENKNRFIVEHSVATSNNHMLLQVLPRWPESYCRTFNLNYSITERAPYDRAGCPIQFRIWRTMCGIAMPTERFTTHPTKTVYPTRLPMNSSYLAQRTLLCHSTIRRSLKRDSSAGRSPKKHQLYADPSDGTDSSRSRTENRLIVPVLILSHTLNRCFEQTYASTGPA